MQLVIFAGGFGTRISEETNTIPKPMVKIGKKPILWHILKYYSIYGFSDFIICGGYKVQVIKKYFKNFTFCSTFYVSGGFACKNAGRKNPYGSSN